MNSFFNTFNANDDSENEYIEILDEIDKSNLPDAPELSIFEESKTLNYTVDKVDKI